MVSAEDFKQGFLIVSPLEKLVWTEAFVAHFKVLSLYSRGGGFEEFRSG
jgi:hypothetical protein